MELDSWAATQRSWLDAAPNAKNYFLIGNHEDRLRRWLWKHPEVASLEALSLEKLFRFDELNITMAGRGGQEEVYFGKLLITHGSIVRKYSAYTAKGEAELRRYAISTLSGHTHRGGCFCTTTREGIIQAVEGFCLCSLTPEYARNPDWQNGLVLAEVTKDYVSFDMIPFHHRAGGISARWRGKEYKA